MISRISQPCAIVRLQAAAGVLPAWVLLDQPSHQECIAVWLLDDAADPANVFSRVLEQHQIKPGPDLHRCSKEDNTEMSHESQQCGGNGAVVSVVCACSCAGSSCGWPEPGQS